MATKLLSWLAPAVGLAILSAGCVAPGLAPASRGGATSLTLAADHRPAISVVMQPAGPAVRSKLTQRTLVPGIDIFPDGRCFVRRLDGTELAKNLGPADVRELVAFFDAQGLFFLSNDALEKRLEEMDVPQIQVDRKGPSVLYKLREAAPVNYRTGLQVRLEGQTILLARWDLDLELRWFPQVRELRVIRACVDKVFAVTDEQW